MSQRRGPERRENSHISLERWMEGNREKVTSELEQVWQVEHIEMQERGVSNF